MTYTKKIFMLLCSLACIITNQTIQARPSHRMPQTFAYEQNQVTDAMLDSVMDDDGQTRKCCKVCASEILAGRILTRDLTVSGDSIFNGPATFNDLVTFNGDVINNGTETVENLVVTNATDFPNAPALITVNPALPEDRFAAVPNFQTIQAAINWLQNKKIVNTVISVANGTYPEALNLTSILSTDASKLVIRGDTRDIVAAGINHGSFWNVGGSGPVGGFTATGEAVLAGLAGSSTLSVTGSLGATSPDFVAAGVTAGDRVLIRHNDGTFALYTVAAVAPTLLTFTTNLAVNVNALGAAMAVVPRVEIAPPTGSVAGIIQGTQVKLTGLFINSPTGVIGLRAYPLSNTVFDNVLMFGPSSLISTPPVGSGSGHPTLSTQGGRTFGSTFFFNGSGTVILLQVYAYFALQNSLVAGLPGASVLLSAMSLASTGNSRYLCNIVSSSRSYLATATGFLDIITHSGTALYMEYGSLATGNTGRWRILGTPTSGPTIGVDAHDSRIVLELAPLTLSSINTSFIPVRIGSTAVSGINADSSLNFGSVTMAAGAVGPMVQLTNASRLSIDSITGPITLGTATNGFEVSNASNLIWNAGSFIPVAPSTGTLFDVRGNSQLVIPAGATRTFSNFNTIFNFDNNASGDIFNVIATANAGGINVQARNMSRVLLDTITLSGANTGIFTESGAYVGQVGLATPITNSSTTPFSPAGAKVNTATTIPNYINVSYSTGTIVYNP